MNQSLKREGPRRSWRALVQSLQPIPLRHGSSWGPTVGFFGAIMGHTLHHQTRQKHAKACQNCYKRWFNEPLPAISTPFFSIFFSRSSRNWSHVAPSQDSDKEPKDGWFGWRRTVEVEENCDCGLRAWILGMVSECWLVMVVILDFFRDWWQFIAATAGISCV